MILILADSKDVHVDYIIEKLEERNAKFIRFNSADFPTKAEISFIYSANGAIEYILHTHEQTINLNLIKTLWYRQPGKPIPHENIKDPLVYKATQEECENFIEDIWNSLDCACFPAANAVLKRAQLKISQLKLASTLGFDLAPTLVTNSSSEFLEFYRQNNGQIVSKVVSISYLRTLTDLRRYTEVVSKRDIGYANSVCYSPIIFQAYIPKQVELRITVVEQQVFAVEIHSQENHHTRHDWRRYDHNKTNYFPHQLPAEIEKKCLQLVKSLGLRYGAIDMILTPDGRYIFLEINPNGQYLWIELATGLPISDAVCDSLMANYN